MRLGSSQRSRSSDAPRSSPTSRLVRHYRQFGALATVGKVLSRAASAMGAPISQPPPIERSPSGLCELLGLERDTAYEREMRQRWNDVYAALAGCAPADARPEEIEGYRSEAALRFWHTLEWVKQVPPRSAAVPMRVLEVGSNPYLFTILLHGEGPRFAHRGINYFGNPADVGSVHTQAVLDPQGRLRESSYLYADVERHDLGAVERVDLCLFCEVLEHLPLDPAWAVYNLARRLEVGGRMILTTPNPARLANVFALAFHLGSKDDPISAHGLHGRHNREYTVAELVDLLTGTGLSVLRTATIDVAPNEFSRAAEAAGYGHYAMVESELVSEPRVYRPAWLYRSFDAAALASEDSIAAMGKV